MHGLKELLLETISLQTPRGRMLLFVSASIVIFAVPYHWLENLSLWKLIGWESAPSIGLTRAYWLLLHGDVSAAWERNWLIFPVLGVFGALIATDTVRFLRKRRRGNLEPDA